MNKKIYIPDTNVLFNYIETFSTKNLEYWNINAIKFWERCGSQTVIPSIILTEFCGLWFHKDIDFKNYDFWFQKRLTMFNQMYLNFRRLGVKNCNETGILYQDVMKLSQDITNHKMPKKLIDQIINRLEKSVAKKPNNAELVNRSMKNLNSGKLLDGLDSVIVSFAYEYAKKKSVDDVIVVSFDRFMIETVNNFKQDPVLMENFNLPENVFGISPR